MTQSHRSSVLPNPGSLLQKGLCLGLALTLSLVTTGCADDDDPVSKSRTPTLARFAPSAGEIPIPNDLLYSGSLDGTLNLPVATPVNPADPFIALNTLDGWSPAAPSNITFTRNLDAATVIAGDTVRFFEVTVSTATSPVGGPVTGITSELIPNLDYVAVVANDNSIAIQPLQPLTPSTAAGNSVYMVVVTNGVRDTSGIPVAKDAEYLFASEETPYQPPTPTSLIQLQGLIGSHLTAFATQPNAVRDDVVVSFTYTVQSVGASLQTVLAVAQGNEAAVIAGLCGQIGTCGGDTADNPFSTAQVRVNNAAPTIGTASELAGGPAGIAEMYVGIFESPYYLTEADNESSMFDGLSNDSAPLTTPWSARYGFPTDTSEKQLTRFNPLPNATSSQRMPLLISVPDSGVVAMPPGGYPVVIFQHGIGANRTSLLGVAESLAAEGYAAVAIDLPIHGVSATTGQLNGANIFTGYTQVAPMGGEADVWERTFGMDLIDNATGAPGPDGTADASGVHYINLSNIAVSRDNIQQSVSDLFNLKESLDGLTVMGVDMFDETEVHFIGHSLGGIVGTPFLALQPGMATGTLGMPGSSIPYLLNGSTVFGPTIAAGLLAGAGLEQGTAAYAQFLAAAQTGVDTVDPINHAAAVAASGIPIYLIEIIGGGPQGGVADLVIPNAVADAPFAGTEPLIAALGLDPISATTTGGGNIQGAVRFVEGGHSSLVSPGSTAGDAAAYLEIQAQLRSFISSGGQTLTVTDTAVIQ